MRNEKFENMIGVYIDEDILTFRKWLKSLSKLELLRFCSYCINYHDGSNLDIFEIEKQFSLA